MATHGSRLTSSRTRTFITFRHLRNKRRRYKLTELRRKRWRRCIGSVVQEAWSRKYTLTFNIKNINLLELTKRGREALRPQCCSVHRSFFYRGNKSLPQEDRKSGTHLSPLPKDTIKTRLAIEEGKIKQANKQASEDVNRE